MPRVLLILLIKRIPAVFLHLLTIISNNQPSLFLSSRALAVISEQNGTKSAIFAHFNRTIILLIVLFV